MARRAGMAAYANGSAANPVELRDDDGDDGGEEGEGGEGMGGEGVAGEGMAGPRKEPRASRPMRASAAAAARALGGVTYHVAPIGEATEAELTQVLPSYHPIPSEARSTPASALLAKWTTASLVYVT